MRHNHSLSGNAEWPRNGILRGIARKSNAGQGTPGSGSAECSRDLSPCRPVETVMDETAINADAALLQQVHGRRNQGPQGLIRDRSLSAGGVEGFVT